MLIGLLVYVGVVAAAVIFILFALAAHRGRQVLDLADPETHRRRRLRLQILLFFIVVQTIDFVQTSVRQRPSGAAIIALALMLIVSLGLLLATLGIYPRRP